MLELNNPKIEKTSLNEASRINLNDYIIDLAWSPDGSRLAAASVEGDIFLIHTDSNILEYVKLGEHTGGANSLSCVMMVKNLQVLDKMDLLKFGMETQVKKYVSLKLAPLGLKK